MDLLNYAHMIDNLKTEYDNKTVEVDLIDKTLRQMIVKRPIRRQFTRVGDQNESQATDKIPRMIGAKFRGLKEKAKKVNVDIDEEKEDLTKMDDMYNKKKEEAMEIARILENEYKKGIKVPEPTYADDEAEEEVRRKPKKPNSAMSSKKVRFKEEYEKPPNSNDKLSEKGSSSSQKKKSSSTSE